MDIMVTTKVTIELNVREALSLHTLLVFAAYGDNINMTADDMRLKDCICASIEGDKRIGS